jgi:ligand-binding sensor domain-containing protein/signal transduction histidine kinase
MIRDDTKTGRRGVRQGALAFGLSFLCASTLAQALDPDLAITQYTHRVWTAEQSEEGLPQNSVFSIAQTPDGYLWLATQEGLVRFDGVRFTVFNSRNTPEIRHNDVWKLLVDRQGVLWVATRGGGITRYQDGAFTNYSKPQGLSNDSVQALWEDRNGDLWIGTRGGGLNRFRDGRFTVYTTEHGLSNNTVYAIHGDGSGALWIGTDGGGLNRFADGTFSAITRGQGLSHDTVYVIHEDHEGALWVGTGAGLDRLRDGGLVRHGLQQGLTNENIRALYQDRSGNLWIGTDGGGLNRLSRGRFSAFTTREGLSNDSIGSIFEDREGNLWVGTDAGGLNRLRDNKFVSYSTLEGLSNDNARAILEDRAGDLWVGTFGGLNRFRDGQFRTYTTKDGLSSDVVLSLVEDRDGALWVGTLGGGLNRFKDGRFTAISKAEGLGNETVLSMIEDRQGRLWVGTRSGGLNRIEDGKISLFTTDDGLSNNDIRYLLEGRDGSLWIATLGGGINRYRDGQFTAFTTRDGLSNDLVLALHEDDDGTLWAGTFGGGLNRFRDGRFTAFTTVDGLHDDVVFQILEDDAGNLWMSSNHGVYRVSRAELNAFADGRVDRITSVAYGKADGMKNHECNGAHQPAGWKGRDGRLWFPTIRGITVVDPAAIRINTLEPPVLIEQVRVEQEPVAMDAPVVLAPGSNKLEFRYTALSYQAPERVRFRYMLEGFDPGWVEAGANRIAYYTNLPPGHYRFRVIAANNDGVWNEVGAAAPFHLQPFFYQRKAFYLVYVLAALALVLLGFRYHRRRVLQLKARQQELLTLIKERQKAETALRDLNLVLERRASELADSNAELERFAYVASHDLKEPLRAVVSFTQLLARKYRGRLDGEADRYIEFIVDGARSMRAKIENILAYSRVGRAAEDLAEVDCEACLREAQASLSTAITESGTTVTCDPLPKVRANAGQVEQLFQNLIENAIKFRGSQPPRIHVGARRSDNGKMWCFTVSDNGIGIDPEYSEKIFVLFQRLNRKEDYPGTGIGLAICKRIVESHGGRIWVEPADSGGSRFVFMLPMPRDSSAKNTEGASTAAA